MFVQVHVVVPERYKKFSLFINSCCPQPVKSIAFCIILFSILQAQTVKEYSIDLNHLKLNKEKAEQVRLWNSVAQL